MRNAFLCFMLGLSLLTTNAVAQSREVLEENETTIKTYLDAGNIDPVEGIYKSTTGKYLRLAVKKRNDQYVAIVLDMEAKKKWKTGSVKAYLEKTSAPNTFSVRWFSNDGTSSRQTSGRIDENGSLKISLPTVLEVTKEESTFLKVYPLPAANTGN